MQNISELKLELIEQIMHTEEVETLEKVSKELASSGKVKSGLDFMDYVSEPRKDVTLDQIFAEQNYQLGTYEEFRKEVSGIEWDQSLEELLSYLD